jgi:DNA-binding CsgD family transcriptional regulator
MICSGLASKAIANELGISPKTVEFHRANLLQKTQAGTTAHLVQLATRLGFDQGFSLVETSH